MYDGLDDDKPKPKPKLLKPRKKPVSALKPQFTTSKRTAPAPAAAPRPPTQLSSAPSTAPTTTNAPPPPKPSPPSPPPAATYCDSDSGDDGALYDPSLPNDFLEYRESLKNKTQQKQIIAMNTHIQREREKLVAEEARLKEELTRTGDYQGLMRQQQQQQGGGRGRGMVNMPAWLVEKNKVGDAATGAALPEGGFVVCLSNMVEVTPPPAEVDPDLLSDVRDECQEKYGDVVEAKLARDGVGNVCVWVRFRESKGGIRCMNEMNGRIFDGRRVNARQATEVDMSKAELVR